jgi:hypothetical protein
MVVLDAEMTDPKILAASGGQRGFADRLVDATAAQVADGTDRPQRDMYGIPRMQKRPLLVRRSSAGVLRRAARASALATSLRKQGKLIVRVATLADSHVGVSSYRI